MLSIVIVATVYMVLISSLVTAAYIHSIIYTIYILPFQGCDQGLFCPQNGCK